MIYDELSGLIWDEDLNMWRPTTCSYLLSEAHFEAIGCNLADVVDPDPLVLMNEPVSRELAEFMMAIYLADQQEERELRGDYVDYL